MPLTSLATELTITRILLGESTNEFAKKLGVSQAAVSAWEINTRPVPAEVVFKCFEQDMGDVYSLFLRYYVDNFLGEFVLCTNEAVEFFMSAVIDEIENWLRLCPFLRNKPNIDFVKHQGRGRFKKETISFRKADRTNVEPIVLFKHLIHCNKKELPVVISQDELLRTLFSWVFHFVIKNCTFEEVVGEKRVILSKLTPDDISKKSFYDDCERHSLLYLKDKRTVADLYHLCFECFQVSEGTFIYNSFLQLKGLSGNVYEFNKNPVF